MPNSPIDILIDDRIVSRTTLYKTLEQAKRRYCERNDIGGKQALQVTARFVGRRIPHLGKVS